MSRKLKRVPLTFDWPLHKVWGGYLNPYWSQCADCPSCEHGFDRDGGRSDANAALFSDQWYGNAPFDPVTYGAEPLSILDPVVWARARSNIRRSPGYHMTDEELAELERFKHKILSGAVDPDADPALLPFPTFDKDGAITREVHRLHELWRGQWSHHLIQADVDALVDADRLWSFTHVPRDAGQAFALAVNRAYHDGGYWLSCPNGHRPTAAEVNAWSLEGFGHDAINQATCVEARCKREGVPYTCARCEGSGHVWPSPAIKQQHDDWTDSEPPAGDGYQLWENVSEGSPISPVFATIDDLCAWCEANASTFGPHKATRDEWRAMLEGDFVHARVGNNVFL